jgi:hypothetical protein
VITVSYVGSKGTHLGMQRDLNQMYPVAASQNPYGPGQVITTADCNNVVQDPVTGIATATPGAGTTYTTLQTGGWANNLTVACGNSAAYYRPFIGMGTITRLENQANSSYNALQVSARKSVGALNLTAAYTYSHSIDDSSDRYDGTFVNSYDPNLTRASSNFDERHMLNTGWIYDLPFFKTNGLRHSLLGGWEWSGIESFSTGLPVTIINGGTYGDNAGVGNAVGTGSFAAVIGDPSANVPPPSEVSSPASYRKYDFNPGAFTLPQGLTFGGPGRNIVRNPYRLNFDMGIFKHFALKESTALEFRAEAFNVFNHAEYWLTNSDGANSSMTCVLPPATAGTSVGNAGDCLGSGNTFGEIGNAHLGRILQFSLKFLF